MENKNHKSLKGFTLIEIIITLIISSLLIAFIMMSLGLLARLHNMYNANMTATTVIQKLNYLLQKDNLESYNIKKKKNGFIFNKDSSAINYQYTDSFLIRNEKNKIDSFKFDKLKINTSFEQSPVSNADFVDQIDIIFDENHTIYIVKEYSAKELMQNNK